MFWLPIYSMPAVQGKGYVFSSGEQDLWHFLGGELGA